MQKLPIVPMKIKSLQNVFERRTMIYEKEAILLVVVKNNQTISSIVQERYHPKLAQAIDNQLRDLPDEIWEDEERSQKAIQKAITTALYMFSFPRQKIGQVVFQCWNDYKKSLANGTQKRISKTTGKEMSDDLNLCYEKMKKQLPDVVIPEFVHYLKKLEAKPPVSAKHEPEWQEHGVWYSSQKEHVMGWMTAQMTHGGETSYHRDNLNISARTSYNHWNNPGMALWLLEALGEDPDAVRAADEEAYNEQNKRKRSGIVRAHFPFDRALELLSKDPSGEKIIIRTIEELDKKRSFFL